MAHEFFGGKTILVTGGAGFVGSNLCKRLAGLGAKVVSLDNYFTGSRDNHVEGVNYREGSTKDIENIIHEKPDLVYHLGEYSRVEKSLEDPPELVWELNKQGTFAVLEFCRKRGCKIVYAGSSTKFSDGGLGRDLTPYTWTKATNTELVKNYGKWYGLPFAITYFYNVYGPGEISQGPYSTLIGIFSAEHRRGQPLTVVSPGTQVRNFTHVDDIVDGLLLVGEKGQGDEFGIGAAEAFSILDTAKMFGGEIVMLPERAGNRMSSEANTARVKELGWEQKRKLGEYIKDFCEKIKVESEKSVQSRVLVFSTTFFPVEGEAEGALRDLMASMPEVQFDVITTQFSADFGTAGSEIANARIFRVGKGNKWDKYRLIWQGYNKAKELSALNEYLFAWSLLASYASLAALLWRRTSEVPMLVSLADQKLERVPWYWRWVLAYILKNADQISAFAGHQEHYAVQVARQVKLTASNRSGDVFANQIRFVYNVILKNRLKKAGLL